MTKLLAALFALLLIPAAARAGDAPPRTLVPLDTGWKFHLASSAQEAIDAAAPLPAAESVALPHTWNASDGQTGSTYFRGTGWYQVSLTADPAWKGRRIFVEFDGAQRKTEVFLNGTSLGQHLGGFARFRFELTDKLTFTGANLLTVSVNNEPNDIIPLSGDFTCFGGLYRRVRLVVTDPVHVSMTDLGSPGVFLRTADVSAARAGLTVIAKLANQDNTATTVRVRAVITDRDNHEIKTLEGELPLAAGGEGTIQLPTTIEQPHLWNGRRDPYLYHARVDVLVAGTLRDRVEQPLGFRSYSVKPDSGFWLNGQAVDLHGVNRHQELQDKGWALSADEQRADFEVLDDLGATAVRLPHYQHDQLCYDLCDAKGIVAWAELVFVGKALGTPAFLDNARQQLRELIRQSYNHPAICFWSIGNETDKSEATLPTLQALAAVVKEEDPTRLSVYASHHGENDPKNFVTDVVAFNKYFGWYSGISSDFAQWADQFHAAHPERAFGMSEYGAGASIYQHELKRPTRVEPAGPWHPEEYQAELHEAYWLAMKERPYLWGKFIWVLFDFASAGRHEGDASGINDKGLVTHDRQVRKDAYYWYKANWNDAPMVYLTSRRYTVRHEARIPVKVYSNCDAVELVVNGKSLGVTHATDHRFIWNDVELKTGSNEIRVSGTRGNRTVSDHCAWIYTPGTPYAPPGRPPQSVYAKKQ